jgi:hypothetical protein
MPDTDVNKIINQFSKLEGKIEQALVYIGESFIRIESDIKTVSNQLAENTRWIEQNREVIKYIKDNQIIIAESIEHIKTLKDRRKTFEDSFVKKSVDIIVKIFGLGLVFYFIFNQK